MEKEEQPNQWAKLIADRKKRNQKKIGINKSEYFGLADGIVATDYKEFMQAIGSRQASKVVSAEKLAHSLARDEDCC